MRSPAAIVIVPALVGAIVAACGSFDESDPPENEVPDAGAEGDGAIPSSDGGGGGDGGDGGTEASARSAAYEALVKSHGAIAYWRFAEGVGTKTTSIAGEPAELVVAANGPAWAPDGLFGAESRSMRFLASTTTSLAQNTGTDVKQVGPSDFAIEAWVDLTGTDSLDRWLFLQTGSVTSYGVFVDTNGVTARAVFGNGAIETASGPPLGPGWHHVVMSRANNPLTLWLDAVEHRAPDATSGASMSFDGDFFVGGKTQSTNLLPVDTRIAEVALYDVGLTAAEVAEHHAAGRP